MTDPVSILFAVLALIASGLMGSAIRHWMDGQNTVDAKRARLLAQASAALDGLTALKTAPAGPTPAQIAAQAHEQAIKDKLKAEAAAL